MKHITALLLALALGCGAEAFDPIEDTTDGEHPTASEPIELGTLEQAHYAKCSGGKYGVHQSTDGTRGRCNIFSSSQTCIFPSAWGTPTTGYAYNGPWGINLGTGWTAAERTALGASANQAAAFIDAAMQPAWAQGAQGQSRFFVRTATGDTPGQKHFVTLNKGTVGGGALSSDFEPYRKMVSVSCTASGAYTENYPGAARYCTKWTGNVDYVKIGGWGTPAQIMTAMRNIFVDTFMIGAGNGLTGGCSGCVGSLDVGKTANATTWIDGDEVANQSHFIQSGLVDPAGEGALTCVQ